MDHLCLNSVADLLPEDVSKDATNGENDKEKQHENEVGKEKKFHFFDSCKTAKEGKKNNDTRGDEDDVCSVQIKLVPQELIQKQLVINRPDAQRQQDETTNLNRVT